MIQKIINVLAYSIVLLTVVAIFFFSFLMKKIDSDDCETQQTRIIKVLDSSSIKVWRNT